MKKVIMILLFTTIVCTGCNAANEYINDNTDNGITSADFDNEAITTAANYIINLDSALNSNMQFIAIEYKCNVSDKTKKMLMDAFSIHCSNVFDASAINLADSRYSDENGTLRGVKITINKLQKDDGIHLSFTKKKSSVGAISTEITFVKNTDNQWETAKADTPASVSKIGLLKFLF